MKKLTSVDQDWNVAAVGLDPIEIHLFSKACTKMGKKNPVRQIEVREIASALNIELYYQAVIPGEKVTEIRDPYSRIDRLYGPGCQLESPCPETDREAHFIEINKSWALSTTGLTAIEYNIINVFASAACLYPDIPHCREMHEKAAFEVARRLGLKPVMHPTE